MHAKIWISFYRLVYVRHLNYDNDYIHFAIKQESKSRTENQHLMTSDNINIIQMRRKSIVFVLCATVSTCIDVLRVCMHVYVCTCVCVCGCVYVFMCVCDTYVCV